MRWRRTIKASFATATAPCLTGTKRKQAAQPEDDEAAGGIVTRVAKSVAIRMFPHPPRWALLKVSKQHWPAIKSQSAMQATMNTAFMKKFRVPAGVKNLIILLMLTQTQPVMLLHLNNAAANLHAKNDLETVSVRWRPHRVTLTICC